LGYDVVDNAFFASSAAAARANGGGLRAELGLPERYFFACSRFLARKNIDGLLRGYARFLDRTKSGMWGLVIAGSGEDEPRLRAMERDLGLTGIIWPGFLQYPELPIYFGQAAASGVPLLVSRAVGAASELVADGENGYLFDPANVDDIAEALLRIAGQSAHQLGSMGAHAQRSAFQWGPERFGRGLLAAAGLELPRTQPLEAAWNR
jgi:glycosyltransferase involved in cell wall biosynthesis